MRASNRGVEGEGKLLNDGWNCCKGMAVKLVEGVLKGGRVEGWGLETGARALLMMLGRVEPSEKESSARFWISGSFSNGGRTFWFGSGMLKGMLLKLRGASIALPA